MWKKRGRLCGRRSQLWVWNLESAGALVNAVKGKVLRKEDGSDCQRYDIFNGLADNVDKYS